MSGEVRVVPNSGAEIGVRPCGNQPAPKAERAPGPWVLNTPGFGSGYCVVLSGDGRPVGAALVGGHERPFTADQVRLHGRLMRAAPEMADLLERLLVAVGDEDIDPDGRLARTYAGAVREAVALLDSVRGA